MDQWSVFTALAGRKDIRRVLLHGLPGTGKTTSAIKLFGASGCYNITLHEESTVAELLGMWTPKEGSFVFVPGVAVKAMRDGYTLVINEIDHAAGSVLTALYNIMDDPVMARITLPTSEVVLPHEGFRVVATMNGTPDDLPEALRDRFEVRLAINAPHPDAIMALPEDLREIAKRSYTNNPPKTTYREFTAFARLREALPMKVAAEAIFGKYASDIVSCLELVHAKLKEAKRKAEPAKPAAITPAITPAPTAKDPKPAIDVMLERAQKKAKEAANAIERIEEAYAVHIASYAEKYGDEGQNKDLPKPSGSIYGYNQHLNPVYRINQKQLLIFDDEGYLIAGRGKDGIPRWVQKSDYTIKGYTAMREPIRRRSKGKNWRRIMVYDRNGTRILK